MAKQTQPSPSPTSEPKRQRATSAQVRRTATDSESSQHAKRGSDHTVSDGQVADMGASDLAETPQQSSPLRPDTRGHRERLEDLRDQLEMALASATENMLPQLAGQYRATLEDIAKIEAAAPQASIQDDLKARRNERRHAQRAG